MYKMRVLLKFNPEIVKQPITCELIRRYDIIINILQAQVFPEEEGQLILELENENQKDLETGINFLRNEGVQVEVLEETIRLDEENCINCGACTGVCKTDALSMDPESWKLVVNQDKCLLCETCVEVCPVGALSLKNQVSLK